MPKILTRLLLKQPKSQSGFTLIEVLVASLMVVFFVVGSMQALALSVAIRVKAQERQRADQLIQEDIEAVRLAAENMAPPLPEAELLMNVVSPAMWTSDPSPDSEPYKPNAPPLPFTAVLLLNMVIPRAVMSWLSVA